MPANVTAVIGLGLTLLDLFEQYQAARAQLDDAADDTVLELDAKIEAAFARIAEKKAATDAALDKAAEQ